MWPFSGGGQGDRTETMMQDVAAAHSRAARRVAQMLQTQEQLGNVEQLRERTRADIAKVEGELKRFVQAKLAAIRRGMDKLHSALNDIDSIHHSIESAAKLADSCNDLQSHIGAARAEVDARRQVRNRMALLDLIFSVPETLEQVGEAMTEEQPDWLFVHKHLAELEACREQVMSTIKNATMATTSGKRAVAKYFEGVEAASRQMEQGLFYEARDPLELVTIAPGRLVTVIRIIEREERLDEDRKDDTHRPKKLRERFLEKLRANIENKFDSQLALHSHAKAFLKELDSFYFKDLRIAQDDLPSRFPEHYDIFNFYLQLYHSRLCFMCNRMLQNVDVGPDQVMTLLNWVPIYTGNVRAKLGIDPSKQLQEALLGADEDDLRKRYIDMIKPKIQTWIHNIVKVDSETWLKEHNPEAADEPPIVSDGLYVTNTPQILFQIVYQQIDVAFQPGGSSSFANKLLNLCYQALQDFITQYTEKFGAVEQKFTGEAAAVPGENLFAHIMAAVNNCHRASLNVSNILSTIEAHYSTGAPEYTNASETLHAIGKLFYKAAAEGVNLLVKLMFTDVYPLCQQLFEKNYLRTRKPLKTITATLKDYLENVFNGYVQHDLFELLLGQSLRLLEAAYLHALFDKRFKIKDADEREEFLKCMEYEIKQIVQLFKEFGLEQSEDGKDVCNPIISVKELLEASKSMVCATFVNNFFVDYPDVTLNHLEDIMSLRDDIKSKDAKEMIKQHVIPELIQMKKKKSRLPPVSIFSAMPVHSTTAYDEMEAAVIEEMNHAQAQAAAATTSSSSKKKDKHK